MISCFGNTAKRNDCKCSDVMIFSYRSAVGVFYQQEFQKRGTEGNCIEVREFIIARPETFPNLYEPDRLLHMFTDCFKEKYDVEGN